MPTATPTVTLHDLYNGQPDQVLADLRRCLDPSLGLDIEPDTRIMVVAAGDVASVYRTMGCFPATNGPWPPENPHRSLRYIAEHLERVAANNQEIHARAQEREAALNQLQSDVAAVRRLFGLPPGVTMPDTVDLTFTAFSAGITDRSITHDQACGMFRVWATDQLITASCVDRDSDDGGEAMAAQAVVDAFNATAGMGAEVTHSEGHQTFVIVRSDVDGDDTIQVCTVVTIDFNAGAAAWCIDDGTMVRCSVLYGAAHIAAAVKATLR